ncbi:hypothetical protein TNCV_2576911 [Trichonephila clavipes]|nr:hypothetical protein TNCV_2576911 [Trichonephila clavipes]
MIINAFVQGEMDKKIAVLSEKLYQSNDIETSIDPDPTTGLDLQTTVSGKCRSSPEDEQEKQGESRYSLANLDKISRPILSIIFGQLFKYWKELLLSVKRSRYCPYRVDSRIESTTNSNDFRSKDGTNPDLS